MTELKTAESLNKWYKLIMAIHIIWLTILITLLAYTFINPTLGT